MKMVGSNGTMIAVRLVRSKLRKRDEQQQQQYQGSEGGIVNTAGPDVCCERVVHLQPALGQQQPPPQQQTIVSVVSDASDCYRPQQQQQQQQQPQQPPGQFVWQFPPPYPPPQYSLYNDQDTLVHGMQQEQQGFAKGFRKNIGGRWRRLVKRKPESDTCAIPPELKDQLKTIYVY